MGARSCGGWTGQNDALSNVTIMQRTQLCHLNSRSTRQHSAVSYMKDMILSPSKHMHSDAHLKYRETTSKESLCSPNILFPVDIISQIDRPNILSPVNVIRQIKQTDPTCCPQSILLAKSNRKTQYTVPSRYFQSNQTD